MAVERRFLVSQKDAYQMLGINDNVVAAFRTQVDEQMEETVSMPEQEFSHARINILGQKADDESSYIIQVHPNEKSEYNETLDISVYVDADGNHSYFVSVDDEEIFSSVHVRNGGRLQTTIDDQLESEEAKDIKWAIMRSVNDAGDDSSPKAFLKNALKVAQRISDGTQKKK